MKHIHFDIETDDFYGAYWACKTPSNCAMIAMIGDDPEDYMARSCVKWLLKQDINVLTMSPAKKDYGHHNYPLERVEAAINWLKNHGIRKIGIVGASTTGTLALTAATYFSDITLTIGMTPSDFIWQGFMQGKKDCRRIGDLYQDAAKRGVDAPEAPDEETLGLIDQEHRALFFLSALFLGQFPGKTQPGWAGVPLVKWLADSIPGNLFEKSPDFAAGTEEAAMQNFILIFSNVYSKFATFEQLMKRFNQPVNESDFEGMLDVFAKLVSGASKSVELPEAFQHMDFSGEPEKEA